MIIDKEMRSLGKQLSLSYGVLKSAECPVHLYVTSYDENSIAGQAIKNQGRKWYIFLNLFFKFIFLITYLIYFWIFLFFLFFMTEIWSFQFICFCIFIFVWDDFCNFTYLILFDITQFLTFIVLSCLSFIVAFIFIF